MDTILFILWDEEFDDLLVQLWQVRVLVRWGIIVELIGWRTTTNWFFLGCTRVMRLPRVMSDSQHLYNGQDTHRSALYRQKDSNTFSQVVENLIRICDRPHIWGIDIFFIPKRLHEATDSDIDTLPVKKSSVTSNQTKRWLGTTNWISLHFSISASVFPVFPTQRLASIKP